MPRKKLIIFYFFSYLLAVGDCYAAVDIGVFQEQCAELGFKNKTPESGKCILRLLKTVAHQKAKNIAQQKVYASQKEQQAKLDIEARRVATNNQQIAQYQAQAQAASQQQNDTGVSDTIFGILNVLVQIAGAGIQGYNQGRFQSLPSPAFYPPRYTPTAKAAPPPFVPIIGSTNSQGGYQSNGAGGIYGTGSNAGGGYQSNGAGGIYGTGSNAGGGYQSNGAGGVYGTGNNAGGGYQSNGAGGVYGTGSNAGGGYQSNGSGGSYGTGKNLGSGWQSNGVGGAYGTGKNSGHSCQSNGAGGTNCN